MDPKLLDELDWENFFEPVDDFLDCPLENDCLGDFPGFWDDTVMPLDVPIFARDNNGDIRNDPSMDLDVLHEDVLELERLSTSSPISVLESSSSNSCSVGKTLSVSPSRCGTQRARSKCPRPTTFIPRSPIQLISNSSLFGEKDQQSDAPEEKKKKLTFSSNPPAQAVRKCMHCEITKSPQWRAGPLGPKTLCNACGVRYKSGRLFPEYRPAASPTFVHSVHSNSHRKVLEIRNKPLQEGTTTLSAVPAPTMEGRKQQQGIVS